MISGAARKIKYLIEPHYVLPYPIYLWPEILTEVMPRVGRFVKRKIRDLSGYSGLRSEAYSAGLFDGMELNLLTTGLIDEDGEINYTRLDTYKKSQLPIHGIHAYYEVPPALFKHTYFNMTEYTEHMRKLLKNQVLVTSELMGEGGILVVHSGMVENDLYREKAVQNVIWLLESVRDVLHKKKIYVAVENLEHMGKHVAVGSEPAELKHIHDSIKDPYIKLAFDWGHINTRGPNAKNFDHIRKAIKLWGKDVIYAHIHYNVSHKVDLKNILYGDAHLPLTRLTQDELAPFAETIHDLMEQSSIKDHGAIHLEISPRKIFKLITFTKFGATWEEQKKSLFLIKNIIERGTTSFEASAPQPI